jgi:hypothetical protein
MNDRNGRYARLRYTAAGAAAALALVGAIAGAAALAASPHAKVRGHVATANCDTTTTSAPDKAAAPHSSADPHRFLDDIQRLVDDGTITATEGQTVDREILAGKVDTDSLASSGFTPSQLVAVQQALSSTKRALAEAAH